MKNDERRMYDNMSSTKKPFSIILGTMKKISLKLFLINN